jgi:hypothetical protein
MTSAAVTLRNRHHAQTSAGTGRPEGQAGVGPKAGRHGLPARQVVIQGEDPDEFDSFRDDMWAELAPVGAVETFLARRAVDLSWRLRRAERLQRTVFEAVYRQDAEDLVLWPKCGLPVKPGPGADDLVLGAVVLADFARAKVFDRLLVYERRIENSLYRTMAELQKHQKLRQADTPAPGPTADRDETVKRDVSGGGRSVRCEVPGLEQEEPGHGSGFPASHVRLPTPGIASDDASTNGAATGRQATMPAFHHSGRPSAAEPSCQTKPMCRGRPLFH